jgi:hypothetical protein
MLNRGLVSVTVARHLFSNEVTEQRSRLSDLICQREGHNLSVFTKLLVL